MRLLVLALLAPTVALAQSWSSSFSQAQLEQLLGGSGVKVLVAGAGEPADEVARAAEGLRTRLRESGLTSLVMDAAALGALREDSDESVRTKAAALPWDRLLIVRVYPGAREAAPTAVITVSEPGGPTKRSLVVTRGAGAQTPVAAPPPVVTAPPVASPPPPPPPPAPVPPPAPRDPRELHFGQTIPTRNRVAMVEKGVYLGPRRISGLALYKQLGRADFIERYDGRVRLKWALGIAGGGTVALGMAGVLATVTSRCVRLLNTSSGRCLQYEVPRDFIVPSAIVAGVGAGLILTALIFPGEPVSASELLPAIDKYNAGLEKKAPVTLRLEPSVSLQFAGLMLHGSF